MPASGVVRVEVKPYVSSAIVDSMRQMGEAFAKAGQELSRLADALTPSEGETVDSMSVHFE